MVVDEALEYLCPNCGKVNLIYAKDVCEKYHEYALFCSNCSASLEITAVSGLNNDVNLIVSVVEDTPR